LLYRIDGSYSSSRGWRDAGAKRLNVSPSLTWLANERFRITVHQTLNRDDFDGDGGVAVALTTSPLFNPKRRFSLPDDFTLIEDSQTQVLANASLTSGWEFRNSFLMRRTSEEYFVTEGVYFNPATNEVPREALYFHHTRRPYVNQAELVGRVNTGNLRHTLLFGYDFRNFFTRTDVTAGGGFYDSLTPIDLDDPRETNPPIRDFPIVRKTHVTNRINAFFVQDQIDLLENLKVNVAGRFDDFDRDRHRIFTADPDTKTGIQERNQTAFTYRAGLVYSPVGTHQFYFNANSSFTPVFDIPADGSELEPQTGRGYEVGYRWKGWDNRVETTLGVYRIEQNNLTFSDGLTSVVQAGQQISKGIDLDINARLGSRTNMLVNYGYTEPRFEEFVSDGTDYTGLRPRFAQKHAVNSWFTQGWGPNVTTSLGVRYVGPMFTNNENTVRLGGWTTMNAALGFRQGHWEWTINAENLLNRKRYFLPSDYSNQVYPGPRINVFSTIRFRFS
jgi:iron complex outermembrane receptor protein